MYIPKLHKIWLCQNDKGGIYMYPKMANCRLQCSVIQCC